MHELIVHHISSSYYESKLFTFVKSCPYQSIAPYYGSKYGINLRLHDKVWLISMQPAKGRMYRRCGLVQKRVQLKTTIGRSTFQFCCYGNT